MVAIRRVSSTVAALSLFFIFPSLASAHLLAVSASPSQCVSPLNGSYSATVTITETYFGGTIENIPVGQNVHELASSTDHGNTGINQNYFTQGAVGTQTGPASLGQPTSFTSPSSGGPATQTFTVTTSVPETYVLGNSYMRSPSTATITAPHGGCTPPPPPPPPTVSVKATTTCTVPLDNTYSAAVDITSDQAFTVATGTTSGSRGVNFLTPNVTGAPTSIHAGHTTFTLTGLTQQTVYMIGAPGGNIASVTIVPPTGGCTPPPPPPPPSCTSGQTLVAGQCVTPACTGAACHPTPPPPPTHTLTICRSGQTLTGGRCVPNVCRLNAHSAYRIRAGEMNTIVVSVRSGGGPGSAGTKVRITLPGGRTITRTVGTGGTMTFRVEPKRRGTIYVRSSGCGGATVKVFAPKVPAAHHPPAFTG